MFEWFYIHLARKHIPYTYTYGGTQTVRKPTKWGETLIISTISNMSNPLRKDSSLSKRQVTCAYCNHKRKIPVFSLSNEEHIWCTKCGRTSRYVFGTETAYKLEDIKLKKETQL